MSIFTGKVLPNLGGGWSSSNYKVNDFIKRSKCLGIIYLPQNGGHFKAVVKDTKVNDTLTINLHNPTTDAAKDLVRYMSKYYIINIAYLKLGLNFKENRNFAEHETELFVENENIDFEIIKNTNLSISRRFVIEYVKNCFLNKNNVNIEKIYEKSLIKI